MATWKILFVLLHTLPHAIFAIKEDILHKNEHLSKLLVFNHENDVNLGTFASSGVHNIKKRSTENCVSKHFTFKTNENLVTEAQIGINDTNPTLALAYEDSANLLVATYSKELFGPVNLYYSSDGGKIFTKINDKVDNEKVQRYIGLQEHPRENKKYILTQKGSKSTLWITNGTPRGQDIQIEPKVELPFAAEAPFKFHPSNNAIMMTLANEILYVSEDGGKTWGGDRKLSKVQDAKWSDDGKIYASVSNKEDKFSLLDFFGFEFDSYDNDLQVSEDNGKNWRTLRNHIYSFGVQKKFLFVSKFLDAELMEEGERTLEVSRDQGKTWYEVQLPSITSDQFYSILDVTDDMVFIHVDTPDDTGEGTLYVSDQTGIVYSESLKRHLYPNYEDATDFYKVKSMRGVYITSQLEEDNSVHTMITYDQGGEWRPIQKPWGSGCEHPEKNCYLQIHNVFSTRHGVNSLPPISHENAVGFIMVHGHVASNLQTTDPSVFVSSDGGYTWNNTHLDGPHYYEMVDQGSVLVTVPNKHFPEYTKTLHFSTDEGNCWHEIEFTDKDINITGLLVEPSHLGYEAAIWGHSGGQWFLHTIDFSAVISSTCTENDFKPWTPHFDYNVNNDAVPEENKGCLLGKKETLFRLKPESLCLIKGNEEGTSLVETKKTGTCECTKADYFCDYGYERVGRSDVCVEDKMFKGPKLDICERGHKYEIISKGYRKIPGDECQGGFAPSSTQIDLHKACKEGDRSVLEKQIKEEYLPSAEKPPENKYKKVGEVFLYGIFAALLIIAVVLTILYTRKRVLRNRLSHYRYSMLNRNDYGTDLNNAVATHTTLYDDQSDEESGSFSQRNTDDVPCVATTPSPVTTSNGAPSSNGGIVSSEQNGDVNTSGRSKRAKKKGANVDDDDLLDQVKSYHDDSDVDLLE